MPEAVVFCLLANVAVRCKKLESRDCFMVLPRSVLRVEVTFIVETLKLLSAIHYRRSY